MLRRFFPALAALSLAAPAQAFIADNLVEVQPAGNGAFAVIDTKGIGPMEAWCAAASYARTVLGAAAADHIYLLDGRDKGSRQPMIFTMTPSAALKQAGEGQKSWSVSVTQDGYNLTVSHAIHFCTNPWFDE